MPPDLSAERLEYGRVARRVVLSQILWTAGYSLTTGPFLSYFGQDLGARGRVTSLLLITPELAGVVGLFTRTFVRRFRGRKTVWIVFSILARLLSLGIPFAGLPLSGHLPFDRLSLMVGSLAVSQGAQSIAYVAYVAWLADAVPSGRWGRFFAVRHVGEVSVLLIVPVLGGWARDEWKAHVAAEFLPWVYVLAFSIGVLLLTASMVPLFRIEEHAASASERRYGDLLRLREAFADRSMRCLLIHNWWLAAANGITQAAFSRYLYGPLQVGLLTTYLLYDVMRGVEIPVSLLSGTIADKRGNKRLMIVGVLVAGSSLFFWLATIPGRWWWLLVAFACWGAFPAVNITGRNLVLKLSPPGDYTAAMALFRQVGGLLAGLSGLIGGWWLESLEQRGTWASVGPWRLGPYQILFATSLVGRLTAALWLFPIREPPSIQDRAPLSATDPEPKVQSAEVEADRERKRNL